MLTQVILISFILLVIFPKGGFYLNEIPINFSLIALFLVGTFGFYYFIIDISKYKRISVYLISQIVLLILFSLYTNLVIANFGFGTTLSQLIGTITTIFPVPLLSIFYCYLFFRILNDKTRLKIFDISIIIILIYGFITFLDLNLLKLSIGIPYLTFTGAEFDISLRNIDRQGSIVKLISTYNNGNIFGTSILLWMVIFLNKKNNFIINLMRITFPLTVARTVWLGWIYIEVISSFLSSKNLLKTFIRAFFLVVFVLLSVYFISSFLSISPDKFFFDPNLGGRAYQFGFSPTLLGKQFTGTLEITYLSMLRNFGVVGLIIFLITWFFPLFLKTQHDKKTENYLKLGISAYCLMMVSDGAFVFFPTQFTYWFMVGILFFGANKSENDLLLNAKIDSSLIPIGKYEY